VTRFLVAAAIVFSAAHAIACQRPTDPGGFGGYDYGTDKAVSFDGQRIRIWYTLTGQHAVSTTSSRMDMVPDDVVTAATVGDAALVSYAQMGFLPPISDGNCGGDGKLDIYLMHFSAADGDASTESCTNNGAGAMQCAAFGLVEARLDLEYGDFAYGAHVVIAHEIFHAVQDAYDAGLDRFWAEGTAQWAAKVLDPAETDFEANLPAFFSDAGRSIDVPPGNVTAGYFYGSAVLPLFLTKNAGMDTVRAQLAKEATQGPPSMDALAASLADTHQTLSDQYVTFAAWNAATGSRAGSGGYPDAAKYPAIKTLAPLTTSGVSDIASGYSVFFYQFDFGNTPLVVSLTGDPTRVAARTFPTTSGKGHVDQLMPLPATLVGSGVVVVAGVSSKKSDAPFSLQVAPMMSPDMGTMEPPMPPMSGGGCALDGRTAKSTPWVSISLALLALFLRRRSSN
jgi:hypothetical protein